MHARTTALVAGVMVLGFALVATAGVYDDVTAWWHFDYADSGTVGAANEIRDQRTWESAGAYVATGLMSTPSWTTTGVPQVSPAGGLTHGSRALELNDSAGSQGFSVNNLSVTGDASVFVRYRWDGSVENGGSATLYWNGFGWSANKGWMARLGVTGDPQFYYGQSNVTSSGWTSTANTWYDLAITVDDNGTNDTVTFHRWEDGGAYQQVTRNVNWFGGEVNSNITQVGYEGTNFKYFGGALETVGIWDRTLSQGEVVEAFSSPSHAWSIGIDNGSNADLRLESQTDADYNIGDPWHEMRRAVSTGQPETNVHFTLSADEANLAHLFHLDVHGTDGGSPLDLDVQVNGHSLGLRTVAGTSDQVYLVPASVLNGGANTLTLQRVDGTAAYASWDWMELGGAWQVGYDDDTQAEFSNEGAAPDDFYVTDPNWLHLERAIKTTDPDINLHFFLSDALANQPFDGMAYYYTTEIISQGDGTHPFDVLLNGGLVAHIAASPDHTVVSLGLPWALIQAGENILTLRYTDSAGWLQFDYHNLQMLPEPTTMTLLGIGGLALLRRRRKERLHRQQVSM